jgi:hypothetical protein
MSKRIPSSAAGVFSLLLALSAGAAPIPLGGPTTDWTPMTFGGPADPLSDAGNAEAEIVGDASHSAVYYAFDDFGTPSTTDGTLYFRMRLGRDLGAAGFTRTAVLGVDADLDGDLDVFLGIIGSSTVFIRSSTGAATSPVNTGIGPSIGFDVAATAANSNWSAVSATTDPTATDFDLNGDGTDHFISWSVDFATVVTALQTLGIGGFTEGTAVRFVAGTSTGNVNINADLTGTDGNTGSSSTWAALGATNPSPIPVPEPGTGALLGLGLAGLAHRRRRARSRRSR